MSSSSQTHATPASWEISSEPAKKALTWAAISALVSAEKSPRLADSASSFLGQSR